MEYFVEVVTVPHEFQRGGNLMMKVKKDPNKFFLHCLRILIFQEDNIMVTVIVQHEVRDFADWKKIFDADDPSRSKEGVKLEGLYSSVGNPNDVTMIFTAPDARLFESMMSNPERQEAMKEAGVIGVPSARILNQVES
jgi:hypothetical protein